jgi:hypothetical protein
MAATAAGRALTEKHRLAQARIGARTVADMHTVWPVLVPANIDNTAPTWVAAATPIIAAHRADSAQLAGEYVTAFKAVDTGITTPPPIILAPPADPAAVATSLLVTGPYALRRGLAQGVRFDRAVASAEAASSAAAMRHALNGGRATVLGSLAADRHAQGYARATSGKACAFCAMLASRGPVYSLQTVDFHSHDHCSCTAEPIYGHSALPPGSQHYADLWQQARDAEGDTFANFRHLVDA